MQRNDKRLSAVWNKRLLEKVSASHPVANERQETIADSSGSHDLVCTSVLLKTFRYPEPVAL